MPGVLLANERDVQIGHDDDPRQAGPMLLRLGTDKWAGKDFNPWSLIEVGSEDSRVSSSAVVKTAGDAWKTRQLEFTVWFDYSAQGSNAASFARAGVQWLAQLTMPPSMVDTSGPLFNNEFSTGLNYEQELSFRFLGRSYVLYGRYQGMEIPGDWAYRTQFPAKVRFQATDPLAYDIAETTLGIPILTAIYARPFTYPLGFAALSPNCVSVGPFGISNQQALPPRWRLVLNIPSPGPAGGANQPAVNPCIINATHNRILGVGNSQTTLGDHSVSRWDTLDPVLQWRFRDRSILPVNSDDPVSVASSRRTYITTGSRWDVIPPQIARIGMLVRSDAAWPFPTGATANLYYRRGYWGPN